MLKSILIDILKNHYSALYFKKESYPLLNYKESFKLKFKT